MNMNIIATRGSSALQLDELRGFTLPEWMLTKVSAQMAAMRTDSLKESKPIESFTAKLPEQVSISNNRLHCRNIVFHQKSAYSGPFKGYITIFCGNLTPSPRNTHSVEPYTFVTQFSRKSGNPTALRNI